MRRRQKKKKKMKSEMTEVGGKSQLSSPSCVWDPKQFSAFENLFQKANFEVKERGLGQT